MSSSRISSIVRRGMELRLLSSSSSSSSLVRGELRKESRSSSIGSKGQLW